MKIKAAQVVGGISLITCFLSNFMFVLNWIVEKYGAPRWSLDFLTWPLSFAFEFASLLIFVLMYKKSTLRYLGFGVYLLSHLVYSFYWMNQNNEPFIYGVKVFINWPFWGSSGFSLFGELFGFITFITIIVAVVLSFFDTSPSTSISHQGMSMAQSNVPNFAPQAPSRSTQGNLSEIEILGDLLKKGLLTQEEFDRKKREILGFN